MGSPSPLHMTPPVLSRTLFSIRASSDSDSLRLTRGCPNMSRYPAWGRDLQMLKNVQHSLNEGVDTDSRGDGRNNNAP